MHCCVLQRLFLRNGWLTRASPSFLFLLSASALCSEMKFLPSTPLRISGKLTSPAVRVGVSTSDGDIHTPLGFDIESLVAQRARGRVCGRRICVWRCHRSVARAAGGHCAVGHYCTGATEGGQGARRGGEGTKQKNKKADRASSNMSAKLRPWRTVKTPPLPLLPPRWSPLQLPSPLSATPNWCRIASSIATLSCTSTRTAPRWTARLSSAWPVWRQRLERQGRGARRLLPCGQPLHGRDHQDAVRTRFLMRARRVGQGRGACASFAAATTITRQRRYRRQAVVSAAPMA